MSDYKYFKTIQSAPKKKTGQLARGHLVMRGIYEHSHATYNQSHVHPWERYEPDRKNEQ